MAFLGKPNLMLGTPSRTGPTTPGTVRIDFTIPLFIDLLEICMVKSCDDAQAAPIFQLSGEIWSTDRDEPPGTWPITPDQILFPILFHQFSNEIRDRRVLGQEIANAARVPNDPNTFLVNITDFMDVAESALNEDWGPFPPFRKPPSKKTEDEMFLRVYLASLFSAWQTIDTKDSDIQTGQFFGP